MARRFRLRSLPGADDEVSESNPVIDRREFMRYSFNTAAGVITMASLGSIGFASLLMGTAESSGGDTAVRFWVPSGAEDSVWYGDRHLESMSYSAFVNAATDSPTGMVGAQGVWSGLPVNVMYVPHTENASTPIATDKPRFQFMDGYTESGKYVGSGYELEEDPALAPLSIHDNLVVIFSRCTHLCCIPGWQLVQNDFKIINGRPVRSMRVATNCSVSATQVASTRPRLKRIEIETVRLERSLIISASAEPVAPRLSASHSSRGLSRATRLKPSRTSKTGTHIATEVR